MRKLPLNKRKSYYALIDDEDFERVIQHKWYKNQRGYAVTLINSINVVMHRFILRPPVDKVIDHKDGNKLNNQKSNIRICTQAENRRNNKKNKNNTSGYKGVVLMKSIWNITKPWNASIVIDYKHISLGCYATKEEAALAYNKAAIKYHGEFAYLNVIQ